MDILRTKEATRTVNELRRISERAKLEGQYSSYLSDESKLSGSQIRELLFPLSTEEVSFALWENFQLGIPTRISGSRSGLAGGAVPEKGESLVSLENLKGITRPEFDQGSLTYRMNVGAGVTLKEVNEYLQEWGGGWYFPVDPTETLASLGGMASTNASGARSYYYGPMRDWIAGATIVLVHGSVLRLRREERLNGLELKMSCGGVDQVAELRPVPRPNTKNTLGYFIEENGSVLDLFLGAEGTLGVITELELVLAKLPKYRLSYMQFFRSDDSALEFVANIRASDLQTLLAIEFLDSRSLHLAMASPLVQKTTLAQSVDNDFRAAVYLEIAYEREESLVALFEKLENLLSDLGASSEESYAGMDDKELREIKIFRHAVPERINSIIAQRKTLYPALHKVATDMAVPNDELVPIYRNYRDTLVASGLEFAIFGHAGNNHFHVNLLPRDPKELARAKELYMHFAEKVVQCGGAVAAEHGIGRLKRQFLELQFSQSELASLQEVKKFFDPRGLLNTGVLLPDGK